MIDKTNIIETVVERLKKLPEGHYLDLRTYKRNRSVVVIKNSEDEYSVLEDGFLREKFHVKSGKLKKLLSTILKKEFPRSHKIRLYAMGKFSEEEIQTTRRKTL